MESHTSLDKDITSFDEIPYSYISVHTDSLCCRAARQAVLNDIVVESLAGSLTRVPFTFPWGPIRWPVYWCSLLTKDREVVADCGVHAALAREVLAGFGEQFVEARVAIRDFGWSVKHWHRLWREEGLETNWVGTEVSYHEVVGIGQRYWDPSEARFFDGVGATLECGRVVATRRNGEANWSFE